MVAYPIHIEKRNSDMEFKILKGKRVATRTKEKRKEELRSELSSLVS